MIYMSYVNISEDELEEGEDANSVLYKPRSSFYQEHCIYNMSLPTIRKHDCIIYIYIIYYIYKLIHFILNNVFVCSAMYMVI